MAFDIEELAWDGSQRTLRGVSRAVAGDPYQLRIYVPDGFAAKRVELSEGLTPKTAATRQGGPQSFGRKDPVPPQFGSKGVLLFLGDVRKLLI
jgi:hypothetical protein